ncbi:MAG TPA: alpha/beta fold hydrolase [Acetobacteraceae bacterium]|nr:alpha/beta fold hydrolase [Acetobacteraceae bacterium]
MGRVDFAAQGNVAFSSSVEENPVMFDDASSRGFPSVAHAAKRIEIEGSRLNIFEFGAGDPVILGTSYLWDMRMWRPQIESLAKRYRVIVPELWGHGGSGRLPVATTSMQDLAKQHLTMLDHLGVNRFALVGLSLGGMWGAELAMMIPERVSSLVLMGTSLADEPAATREQYSAILGTIERQGMLPDALREAIVPLYFSPSVASRKPGLPAEFDVALRGWNRERLIDSVVPLGRIIFDRRDAMDDLAKLKMPVLVMTGAHDIPRPPEEGRRMAECLGCRFVEIPEAGHISSLEAPEFVTAALEAFLAEQSLPVIRAR